MSTTETGSDELVKLRDRVLQAIREGEKYPLTLFSDDDIELMVRAFAVNDFVMLRFEQELIKTCKAMGIPAKRSSLEPFKKRAREQSKLANEHLKASERQQRQSGESNQRQQQRHQANNTWTPDQMLANESPSVIAAGLLLTLRPGRLWFDTFYRTVVLNWAGEENVAMLDEPIFLDDNTERAICMWLRRADDRLAHVSARVLMEAIAYVAQRTKRNEPRDKLMSQTWDHVERLYSLMPKGFGTVDDEYHRQVGRCWFVSMVARIMEPGAKVDTTPVLQSPEGSRKAQALEIIGGKWYGVAVSRLGSKDFLLEMWGKIVFEIAELHSLIGGDNEKNKAVMTTRKDNFRAPYDRKPAEHARTCVWCGTTNDNEYYPDPVGGRRLWPCACGVIDLAWLGDNVSQLWAEALAYWRLGSDTPEGCWWNVPELDQHVQVERVRKESPFEDAIARWLDMTQVYDGVSDVPAVAARARLGEERDDRTGDLVIEIAWGTLVTTERVARMLGFDAEKQSRSNNAQKIGHGLRALGWTKDRRRAADGQLVRFWCRAIREDDISRSEFTPSEEPEGPNGAERGQKIIPF